MSKREPILLLEDIIESIQKIKIYTSGLSLADFLKDDKTIDTIALNLTCFEQWKSTIE